MRIGIDASFISQKFAGGKEQVIINLIKGWNNYDHDHEILIFGSKCLRDKFQDNTLVGSRFLNRIIFKRMITGIFYRTFILPALVRKHNIDVLLFIVPYTGFSKFKIPTAVIPHDIQFKSNSKIYNRRYIKLFEFLYGNDFRLRDKIISISEYDQKELLKYYPEFKEKILKIENPIVFDMEKQMDRKIEEKYVLAINMAYIHKNIKTLLLAFDEIKERIDCKLVIVGNIYEGDYQTDQLIKRLVESNDVIVTGEIDNDSLKSIIQNAEMFINTSFFEGFGMSAVEAMGLGIPCVLADNSAVKDVTLSRAIYYNPADDKNRLIEAILSVSKNKEVDLNEVKRIIRDKYNYVKTSRYYLEMFEAMVLEKNSHQGNDEKYV